ncbi:glycosyl hydrolase family 28 protein [Cohnella hashimotonis]|uniref:Glycosyl hydrolase family 28 protein n=1 Tax=Cohnella hashimotonis TaxID=2826895 RepID=A0ABT6TT10_9BACL|nr:glycosyl hydrolase family 28 protein [Cohnella hashimotonis]MDI4649991.1 glycosyl hydrolase family 28 protein [Cohnella hashimotonis]
MRNIGLRFVRLLIAAALFVAPLAFGVPATHAAGTVTAYAAPTGAPRSSDFTVTAGSSAIDLYGDNNGWGNKVSYGYFDMTGSVTVSVTVNFSFSSYKLAPASLGLASTRSGNTIQFTLNGPTNVSLILDGNYQGRTLHLFASAPETSVPSPSDPNVIYIGPGYYDYSSTPTTTITVGSGKTLYIAGGAFLNGHIEVRGASNVAIRGRGIVSMNYTSTYLNQPISILSSTNVQMSGIIVDRRVGAWSSLMDNSSQVSVTDYKVVSPTYASTDGLNLVNSHDVTIDRSFFRTADDCIAIKGVVTPGYNASDNPASGAPNYNITIQNSQFWSDANDVWALGAETQAAYYENIKYLNNDVLYSYDDRDNHGVIQDRAVMDITALNGTQFRNILYQDIRVEQSVRLVNLSFADSFWFGSLPGNQSFPGLISGVTFRNITAVGTGSKEIRLWGWDLGKPVSDILFEDVSIDGQYLTDLGDKPFNVNNYVKNVVVRRSASPVDAYVGGLDFSSVQGANQWYYKEWNGSSYANMTWNATDRKWKGTGSYIGMWGPNFVHPESNDAVKAWLAPSTGTVMIKGTAAKWDTGGGDGVRIKIMKNGTPLWPSSGWQTIAATDRLGVQFGVIANVAAGDYVYIVVNKNGTDSYDTTVLDAMISYKPVFNASTDFLTYQGGWNWSYLQGNAAPYTNMNWNAADKTWRGTNAWNIIHDGGLMHPDADDTVRAWTAPASGTVRVTGNARKQDTNGGDGVRVKILKNAAQLWPASGWQAIAYNDATGASHSLTVSVTAGDVLYFVLDKNGNNSYDTTYWSPNILYT